MLSRLPRGWGCSPSTISRLVIKRRPRKVQGRKPLLTKGMVDKLEAKVEAMIQKADSEYEVIVTMLKRASRWVGRRRCALDLAWLTVMLRKCWRTAARWAFENSGQLDSCGVLFCAALMHFEKLERIRYQPDQARN